jgi:hypothetical protein
MPEDSASRSRNSNLVRASAHRLDASFQQLEALHKSSGAESNLRIPSGKRIKLHDPVSDNARPASKKRPKFNMDFSALMDDDATASTCFFDDSDSDDFPELHELVQANIHNVRVAGGSLASLPSDYSDSEMDAVIREAHVGGIAPTPAETDIVKSQDVSTLQPIHSMPTGKGSTNGDPTSAKIKLARPLLPPQVCIHW